MGQVWTLDDWNDIIRQVNDLAQNPDDGCSLVVPLDEVEAPHKWSRTDIQAVQEKLKEICEDNSFGEIPDKWKQSIVDEINEAIANGWCNCDECCPDCDDAGEENETTETVTASGCWWSCVNCASCPDPWAPWADIKSQALSLGSQANSAAFNFADWYRFYCQASKECDSLQENIDRERDPAKLAQLQAQLEMYETLRDWYESEANSYRTEADEHATAQAALLSGFTTPDTKNMWYMVTSHNHPWSDIDCDKLCEDWGPERCLFRFSMTYTGDGSYWASGASGMFTPNGLPYATSIDWIHASRYTVACCGPHCDTTPPCAGAGSRNYTWRVTEWIDPSGYSDCPDGGGA